MKKLRIVGLKSKVVVRTIGIAASNVRIISNRRNVSISQK